MKTTALILCAITCTALLAHADDSTASTAGKKVGSAIATTIDHIKSGTDHAVDSTKHAMETTATTISDSTKTATDATEHAVSTATTSVKDFTEGTKEGFDNKSE